MLLLTSDVYRHLYYNNPKDSDDKVQFNAMLDRPENDMVNGTPDPEDTKLHQKYFWVHETPVRG